VHATTDSEHPSAWPIEIEQNATASWTKQGKTYRRYAVTVTNRSPKTVHELHIGISKLYGQVWGVDKARYGYVLPSWIPSLLAGKSAVFVYVQAAPPADVWVTGYKLI
jgi:endoglucanase